MTAALITGGSAGLGRALAIALAGRGWDLVIDARGAELLAATSAELRALPGHGAVLPVAGDIAEAAHRDQLAAAVETLGRLDLLVNNASTLGPTPLPGLAELQIADLDRIYQVNVHAPLALFQLLLPALAESGGMLVNISSDAAVAHYEGWGGYGSAKAALDHLTLTLAAEHPALRCYAVDPGDMRTAMHQAAFPGEDISDRPLPESVVPGLLELIDNRPASGRYRAADLAGQPHS
jgi:NAD(P)-dependent dehydrogenase (short-subunit alcohol dehydrogenase family)